MRLDVPHPIPYQGSKRQLAGAILSFIPKGKSERLIEPFAGSAAVTLAAATRRICSRYVVSDVLPPLVGIWRLILDSPEKIIKEYDIIWRSQLANPAQRFNEIRKEFNRDKDPAKLLFLLARCVKNAVRFSRSGEFNQSADKRRLGVRPETLKKEIVGAHHLLAGWCEVRCASFQEILRSARSQDVVYLDPPYEGVSNGKDSRYIEGVRKESLIKALEALNARGVQYLLSYDGICGDKS